MTEAAKFPDLDDLEDLFENAPCGYLSTDKDGRIGRANRTFSDWAGYSASSLAGRRFSDLLSIVSKVFFETHFAPTLHMQGRVNEIALDIVRSDGSKMPVLLNAIVREGSGNRPTFVRFTIFNATERRRYEADLVAARDKAQAEVRVEKVSAELREQFIAVLGHDLRNPLAAVASGLRLLDKENLSPRGRQVTRLMDGSIVRAAGLIDNVLDFARGRLGGGLALDRDSVEPLEPVLRQVIDELRSVNPGRIIEADYDICEPVDCDRVRLGQLVSNLVGNAVTHGAPDKPITFTAKTTREALVVSIANGGDPIPPATQARLFQPFFRGELGPSREGLGLGLHIASEIAKAHGGELIVSSDALETRFTFMMPLVP